MSKTKLAFLLPLMLLLASRGHAATIDELSGVQADLDLVERTNKLNAARIQGGMLTGTATLGGSAGKATKPAAKQEPEADSFELIAVYGVAPKLNADVLYRNSLVTLSENNPEVGGLRLESITANKVVLVKNGKPGSRVEIYLQTQRPEMPSSQPGAPLPANMPNSFGAH